VLRVIRKNGQESCFFGPKTGKRGRNRAIVIPTNSNNDKDNGRAQAETTGHGQKTTSLQGDGEGYRGRTDVKLAGGGRG
jgi:hypothetical protein